MKNIQEQVIQNSQLLVVEIPVGHRAIAQILAEEDVQRPHDMSHHAVPDHNDLFEAREDLADLLGREPPHVAVQRDERAVESDPAAAGKRAQEVVSVLASRRKGRVEIERGDLAVGVVAEFVGSKRVDRVWLSV